jgi:hypothetical protein
MIRRVLLLLLGVACLSWGHPGPRSADGAPAPVKAAADNRLLVTIWPRKAQVGVEEEFDLLVRVSNATEHPQSFRVMNCSWREHWRSDSPFVAWGDVECTKNFPVNQTLPPGGAYEKTLNAYVAAGFRKPGKGARTVTFRLGFTPEGGKKVYWSNKVVVGVKGK